MDLFPGIYKGKSYRKAFYGRKRKRDSKIYSHGKRGINEYRIEPVGTFPAKLKEGAPITRIYRSVTDGAGAYAIPVDPGEEQLIEEVMVLHI